MRSLDLQVVDDIIHTIPYFTIFCPEGRKEDLFGAMEALKAEHGLEGDPMMLSWVKLTPVSLSLGLWAA